MENKSVQWNIYLPPWHAAVVTNFDRQERMFNRSMTLRRIIKEWAEFTDNTPPVEDEVDNPPIAGLA